MDHHLHNAVHFLSSWAQISTCSGRNSQGRHVVIVGAGGAGLAAAYEAASLLVPQ